MPSQDDKEQYTKRDKTSILSVIQTCDPIKAVYFKK
jgi:hypothetical protein